MYFSLCSTTRQILRDAQNDTLVGNFHFDTPSANKTFKYPPLLSNIPSISHPHCTVYAIFILSDDKGILLLLQYGK